MIFSRILLVDDEETISFMLASRLRERGYTVTVANNGYDGLAEAMQDPPDLIITDYQMPKMDGLALAAALKTHATTAGVPVIMLTARGHKLPLASLQQTNIRQLMSKPFSAKEVLAQVHELLNATDGPNARSTRTAA